MAKVGYIGVDGVARKNKKGYIGVTETIALNYPTPNGLPGIPMQDVCEKHNFTDSNGRKWFTDEINLATGIYIERCFTLVFDGTEPWYLASEGILCLGSSDFSPLKQWDTGTNTPDSGHCAYHMCSHFQAIPRYTTVPDMSVRPLGGTHGYTLCFYWQEYTGDLEGWKKWLAAQYAAGTPVTMLLGRRTPIETPLSEEIMAQFQMLQGKAPASVVCDDPMVHMEITYDADHRVESLTLYGKTVQSETPTPGKPVYMENCGADGDIIVTASVPDVAHRLRKGYIGIGGVARPCWSGEDLAYYGTITGLSVARLGLAAATIGDFALFGGGENPLIVDTVDAYDKTLTRTTPTALSVARGNLAAATIGDFALFGGGSNSLNENTDTVDAYDKALTRTTPTALSVARSNLAAATIGDFALFGGGASTLDTVDAYDQSLTRTTPAALSVARSNLAAATIGDFALFGGGFPGYDTVDAYDKALTRTTPAALSVARGNLAAATIGNYALFGGGITVINFEETSRDTVDAYDQSLTRTTPAALSAARGYCAAIAVGNYALFGGGGNGLIGILGNATTDAYDKSLTRTTPTALSVARGNLAAATIGDFALFGGGTGPSDVVDAYTAGLK